MKLFPHAWSTSAVGVVLNLVISVLLAGTAHATASPAQQLGECITQALHLTLTTPPDGGLPHSHSDQPARDQDADRANKRALAHRQCSEKLHRKSRERGLQNAEQQRNRQQNKASGQPTSAASSDLIAPLVSGGSISGTVTDGAGNPAPSWVYAYEWQDSYYTARHDFFTSGTGFYEFTGLPAATYRIEFDYAAADGNWAGEFFDNAEWLETATDIVVTDGSSTTNIDAQLALAGHITGTVTDHAGNPIDGMWVPAYRWNGSYWQYASAGDHTDANGFFDIGSLASGDYRIEFTTHSHPSLLSEYYDNAAAVDSATSISVTAGATTANINAQLALAGWISGTVTDSAGAPLSGVSVSATQWNGSYWEYRGGSSTDAAGDYRISGLATGNYRVEFNDYSGGHLSEFYPDAPDVDSGTDVAVSAGSTTTGIDAQLEQGGHVTGTVTDQSGNPLENVQVNVRIPDLCAHTYTFYASGNTNAAGFYDVGGLRSGDYEVYFVDSQQQHVREYFNDAETPSNATLVPVTTGASTDNIDAQLTLGGHITGTVTDDTGAALSGINVFAYRWNGDYWEFAQYNPTDAAGNYDLAGLASGNYRIRFDTFSAWDHVSEVYNDVFNLDDGVDVNVNAPGTTSGIDAVLATAGFVTGTVTNGGGSPLPNISATVSRWNGSGWEWVDSAATDATGFYRIGGLRTGTHKVDFDDYNSGDYLETLVDNIAITTGITTSGVDAIMGPAGKISGVITDPAGNTVPGVSVDAFFWDGGAWQHQSAGVFTDGAGAYRIGGLPTGSYRIRAAGYGASRHAPTVYPNATSLAGGTDVPASVGNETTGIDIQLGLGGGIAGAVTDAAGNPLACIDVSSYSWDGSGWRYDSSATTDSNGLFELNGLGNGNHRVEFIDNHDFAFQSEVWDNAATLDSGNDVPVTPGNTTPSIDAVLAPIGTGVPAAPTLIGPNSDTTQTLPTFSWNPVSGADDYELWVRDVTGDVIVTWYSASATGCAGGSGTCSITPATALGIGDVDWWVRARNAAGNGPWSSVMEFAVLPVMVPVPGPATLISPSGTIADTTPSFSWNAVSDATDYELQVDDATGTPIQQSYTAAQAGCGAGTGTCSVSPSTTVQGVSQWWVRTSNAAGNGPWSSVGNFEAPTPQAPVAAVPTSPSGNVNEGSPTYTWEAVADSSDYRLQVDDVHGNQVLQWFTAAEAGCGAGTGSCSVTPTATVEGDSQWRVQTWNSQGTGPWSNFLTFTGATVVVPPGPPLGATLIAPQGVTATTTPTYSWSPVADAEQYYLWVNDASGNRIKQWYTAAEAGCQPVFPVVAAPASVPECSVTPTTEVAGASEWFVQTWNNNGYGPWSAAMNFSTPVPTPPEAATLASPSGNIDSTLPTYTWQAVASSTWYYLFVNDSTGNRIKEWYSADEAGCGSGAGTCSITPSTEVQGASQWWIQTWNPAGEGPWSTAMDFTVNVSVPTAATPIAPSGTSTYTLPTYTWTAVAGSSYYLLQVNDATGQRIKTWYTAAEAGCESGTGNCSVTPSTEVQGVSQWWVQTYNIVGTGPWSAAQDFTVNGTVPTAATLVDPVGSHTDNTMTYLWNAVDGATWYYLFVADGNGGTPVKRWFSAEELGCANGASTTCWADPETTFPDGNYQWWVQTYNVYGTGPWSDPLSFDLSQP